ncbi:chromate resistance protein ChrB domain-containing protein [Denitromonas sp.]|uniref:chromate resistance protein ChrB domain-containing protein n=1 Tax=Denitromonas sp. TaxID=2734609 RepID=UPI002AFE0804|nr:chromate resistance protein ChrB domain-containing protein [Denitromonas sp.]
MNQWIALITSLPTRNATARMRAWRALKSSGAAVLRDGVYLMPEIRECRRTLDAIAEDVIAAQGSALVVRLEAPENGCFETLFDRSHEYGNLKDEIVLACSELASERANDLNRRARKLRKSLDQLMLIDFFPGEARHQVESALNDLDRRVAQLLSPDEPRPVQDNIVSLAIEDYQGRAWATRKRPWVDRLACAWLIRRFIDADAKILWLDSPTNIPPSALGFDFDGAAFTHVGAKVSFEVLMASFGLETQALHRLATLVHYLDVGGVSVPEAAGVETVLAGLRDTMTDDDELLALAMPIFDGLHTHFGKH